MGDGSGGLACDCRNNSIAMDQRTRRLRTRGRRRRRHPAPPRSHRRRRPSTAVPVLYIGGCQRSGSTLLDRMMSQSARARLGGRDRASLVAWALVERALWMRGALRRLPVLAEVGRLAFGGWGSVDVELILRLQRRVDRNRYIIFMVFPALSPRYRRDLERYVGILDRLYRAIYAVGGGAIVDSSKHASTAFLLRRVPSGSVPRRPSRPGQPRRGLLAPEEDPPARGGRW